MKIALINEMSQANKNKLLNDLLVKHNHTVVNYGMFSQEDERQISYVHVGLLASILISSKAADFIITGCGTGQGAMLSCNSFPNLLCGHIQNGCDAFYFSQVNAGNAISIPLGQNFGWAAEINIENIIEQLFKQPFGQGYPSERAIPIKNNRLLLDSVRTITQQPLLPILHNIDPEFLNTTINYPEFKNHFFKDAEDNEITQFIRKFLHQ